MSKTLVVSDIYFYVRYTFLLDAHFMSYALVCPIHLCVRHTFPLNRAGF